jgi:hypothetical protein
MGVGGEAKEKRAKEGSYPSERDVDSPPARKERFLSDLGQFFPKRDKGFIKKLMVGGGVETLPKIEVYP